MKCLHQFSAKRLCLLLGLSLLVDCARPSSNVDKVRHLRSALEKVAGSKGLTPSLVSEARKVEKDADQALATKANDTALGEVVAEYKHFLSNLMHRQEELTQPEPSTPTLPSDQDPRLAKLLPVLEAKARTLLSHITSDKDKRDMNQTEAVERDALVKRLQEALAKNTNAVEHAVQLHEALSSAHGFLAQRVADMAKVQKKLSADIENAELKILYGMLKQRRKLPIKGQLAILRRRQFKKCSYAAKLLKSHNETGVPLYQQLEAMLPKDHGSLELSSNAGNSGGHLAAAGSDGRVQVVSSRLKNSVNKMLTELTAARDKLARLAAGKSEKPLTADDKKQAQTVLAGLDDLLGRAHKTSDLKTQLELMDEIQHKLESWSGASDATKGKSF